MVHIIGEYPYYRAAVENWRSDLHRIHAEGITTVSFYLPWRLHEIRPAEYDFSGIAHPNADLHTLFAILADLGMTAVVKPGPFIHAEIRYGGLPDRIIEAGQDRAEEGITKPGLGTGFETATPLQPDDPIFLREALIWLRAVRQQVIEPHANLVHSIQIGNEGVFSDASRPTGSPRDGLLPVLLQPLAAFANIFEGLQILRYVNLPLPDPHTAQHLSYHWWTRKVLPLADVGDAAGYTAWAGASGSDPDALARTILAAQTLTHGCVEENWGHTWDSNVYRQPHGPLHHSVLALALGCPTLSIYTACSTDSTDVSLHPTASGLLAEGLEPHQFSGVYCPGAPLTPGGTNGPTLDGLRRLMALTQAIDDLGQHWRPEYHLDIVIDPSALPWTWKAATIAADLFSEHRILSRLHIGTRQTEGPAAPALLQMTATAQSHPSNTTLSAHLHTADRDLRLNLGTLTAINVAANLLHTAAAHEDNVVSSPSTPTITWVSTDFPKQRITFIFNRSNRTATVALPEQSVESHGTHVPAGDVSVIHTSSDSVLRRLDTPTSIPDGAMSAAQDVDRAHR